MNKLVSEPSQDDGIPTLTQVLAPGDPAPEAEGTLAVPHDVAVLAERLGKRLSAQLALDVASLIEARTRDAMLNHMDWLVQTIVRQVTDDVQRQLSERVRRMVLDELTQRS